MTKMNKELKFLMILKIDSVIVLSKTKVMTLQFKMNLKMLKNHLIILKQIKTDSLLNNT